MNRKIQFLSFLIILTFSCNIPNSTNLNNTQNEFHKSKNLDSLISYGNNIKDNRIILGNLNNLDIIYGYRGLKFMTDFDSIDFSYGTEFDYTYKSEGILIVRNENVNSYTFGKGDDLKLIFLKNKLCQIQISNSRFIEPRIDEQPSQFVTQLNDLTDLFGEPTKTYPIIKDDFQIIVDELDSKKGLSIFNIDNGWDSRLVSLRYTRKWKTETRELPFQHELLRYESSTLNYTLREFEKNIKYSMKIINDSLNYVRDKERDKDREKDLKNMF